jgi:hypothetical protein
MPWWYTPVIPLRQQEEGHEFKTRLGCVVRLPHKKKKSKNRKTAGHQWLMPVILATWEAEIWWKSVLANSS